LFVTAYLLGGLGSALVDGVGIGVELEHSLEVDQRVL